jgi:hypothetical protein
MVDIGQLPSYRRWRQWLEDERFLYNVPGPAHGCTTQVQCPAPTLRDGRGVQLCVPCHVWYQRTTPCRGCDARVTLDAAAALYGCTECGRAHLCRAEASACPAVPNLASSGEYVCVFSGRVVAPAAMITGTFRGEGDDRQAGRLNPHADDEDVAGAGLHMSMAREHQAHGNRLGGDGTRRKQQFAAAQRARAMQHTAQTSAAVLRAHVSSSSSGGRKRPRPLGEEDVADDMRPLNVACSPLLEEEVRDASWVDTEMAPAAAVFEQLAPLLLVVVGVVAEPPPPSPAPVVVDEALPPPPIWRLRFPESGRLEVLHELVHRAVAFLYEAAVLDPRAARLGLKPAGAARVAEYTVRAARLAALLGRQLTTAADTCELLAALLLDLFARDRVARDAFGDLTYVWCADAWLHACAVECTSTVPRLRALPQRTRGLHPVRKAMAQVLGNLSHKTGVLTKALDALPYLSAWSLAATVLG